MRSVRVPAFRAVTVALLAAALLAMAASLAPAGASLIWADDPCEERGGQLDIAPDIAHDSLTHAVVFSLCADGTLVHQGAESALLPQSAAALPNGNWTELAATGTADQLLVGDPEGRTLAVTPGGVTPQVAEVAPGRSGGQPVVELAGSAVADRGGWLVRADGSVEAVGDASTAFEASSSARGFGKVVGASVATDGQGLWLVTTTGAVLRVAGDGLPRDDDWDDWDDDWRGPGTDDDDEGSDDDDDARWGAAQLVDQVHVPVTESVIGIVDDPGGSGAWVVADSFTGHGVAGAPDETDTFRCLTAPGSGYPAVGAVSAPPGSHSNGGPALWVHGPYVICGFRPGA